MAAELGVPRSVVLAERELGQALGEPGDREGHRRNLLSCLEAGVVLDRGESVLLRFDG